MADMADMASHGWHGLTPTEMGWHGPQKCLQTVPH